MLGQRLWSRSLGARGWNASSYSRAGTPWTDVGLNASACTRVVERPKASNRGPPNGELNGGRGPTLDRKPTTLDCGPLGPLGPFVAPCRQSALP